MEAKQFLPLALLYTAGGEIRGKTRFQKLAFLSERELDRWDVDAYDFVAYDYGPFSKSLLEETESLEAEGLVEITRRKTFGGKERYDYRLTQRGHETYEDNRPNEEWDESNEPEDVSDGTDRFRCIEHVADRVTGDFAEMPVSNLIDHVYDEYPKYAENSVFY
ncbi:hypothetical protein RYH80_08445 [Halobaculum sp. MBLA0147]|uniref:hypothetical protein n=1 Tax=Halobaculum sp. MBLA0147 TaxID=3079934 RepID=UPI00352426FC